MIDMKKVLALLLLLLPAGAFAQFNNFSQRFAEESESVTAFREHVGFLSSAALEGRKSGSEGEREAAEYLSDVFASYGIDVLSGKDGDVFGMKLENGDTLVSRNVVACIPGYDPKLREKYIVIGARLDNSGTFTVNVNGEMRQKTFFGANGNASGLAMLAELGRMLSTNSVLLKRSVLLVGFGSSLNMNAGSWYFLNRSFSRVPDIDAMINLDMLGTGSRGFYAYTASNRDMSSILNKLSDSLQPVHPELVSIEPVESDHRMFYDKEIPSVLFTTGMYPEYNTERDTESIIEYEDMEREMEYIYNYALSLANGKKPEFRVAESSVARTPAGKDVVPYFDCDVKPAFLNSYDPSVFMQRWVYVYLKYPQQAIKEGIQGRVMVNFVVDEKGKVGNVRVVKGVDELLDDEAVKVISASPDWKPARVNGKKVKCEMSVYVEFRLKKNKRR